MYKLGRRTKETKRRKKLLLVSSLLLIGLIIAAIVLIPPLLKPKTQIKQAAAVVSSVSYTDPEKKYVEPDFTIEIPTTWTQLATTGPYHTFMWQLNDKTQDSQDITIYEDTIPQNYAVNKVLIVQSNLTQLTIDGSASDNCTQYTLATNTNANPYGGVPAKWNNVDFWCNQNDSERDSLGTSSTDGINTVVLKNTYGATHKFFFTYTDHTLDPDYTDFYSSLRSFQMN